MISSATSDISKILEKVEIFDKNENENSVVFSYIPDDLKDYCKKLWKCFE